MPDGEVFINLSKTNYQINYPEVRVIDETGKQIGVMPVEKAIGSAKEKGLDLVLITEKVNPPIAKMLDAGKFKYEQEKQLKKQKSGQKTIQLKEVRLTPNISEHDLEVRIKQAKKFIKDGDKVKLTLRIFGRNLQFADDKVKIINKVCDSLKDVAEIETPVKREINQYICFLKPK